MATKGGSSNACDPAANGRAADRGWHALSVAECLKRLDVNADGLSADQVSLRQARHGLNVLATDSANRLGTLVVAQFRGVIVWVLIVAALVSIGLGEWLDGMAITAIVLLNAVIGVVQEYRAGQAIAALGEMTAVQTRVRRDGELQMIAAAQVVVGDIVDLQAGDVVAADIRLLTAAALQCNEAVLTGESIPDDKSADPVLSADTPLADRSNMAFSGASVVSGVASGVVVATGMHSELGRIAGLLATERTRTATPLQRRLDAFGHRLVAVSLVIVAFLLVLGLWRGTPLTDMFLVSVSLAVAAVPEGLPAVVTIALALGVSRMASRRALIRTLPAVETLGTTSVICTDKTGTLTAGEMSVRELWIADRYFEVEGEGYSPAGSVRARAGGDQTELRVDEVTGGYAPVARFARAVVATNKAAIEQREGRWQAVGDPTEAALLGLAAKVGVDRAAMSADMALVRELPFDSVRKLSSAVWAQPNEPAHIHVKGAPEMLLARCTHWLRGDEVLPLDATTRAHIVAANAGMAARALRVLAAAGAPLGSGWEVSDARTLESGLVFIGLAGMQDPPRPEAARAIERCRHAGIEVVMITGDNIVTALAIAQELGIVSSPAGTVRDDIGDALTGVDLDRLDDTAFAARVRDIRVYARVSAAHKLRIVKAWQERGAVVAMTGDGVNDAPALQGADIGVAMGLTGSEVTKQAADMIIVDDDFTTIVHAVEQGRAVYANIRRTLAYLLSGNTGELLTVAACVIAGFPAPLVPIHLLWINLVTDGLPALALAAERVHGPVMDRPPRAADERLVDARFMRHVLVVGILTAAVSVTVFVLALRTVSIEEARTMAFSVLVYAEVFRALGARSARVPLWRLGLLGNRALLIVVCVTLTLQVLSHQIGFFGAFLQSTPLAFMLDLQLMLAGALPALALEIGKEITRMRRHRVVS